MAIKIGYPTSPPAFRWAGEQSAPGSALLPPPPDPERTAAAAREPSKKVAERGSLSYMPALDGLRALAVLAVIAYHADLPWARAGFLGVDVFFVISGFLITALLLNEYSRTGRISLSTFWRRRALRLLPALFVLLAAVSLLGPLLAPDQNETLPGDLIAALTYVSNWWLIFQDQPYFQAIGRPPLLQHLWSLAVEEQFYLLWPLAFFGVLRKPGGNPRKLLRWVLAAIAASALAMAVMYSPEGDTSRVYYGTDTRVGTILAGVALAFVWGPGHRSAAPNRAGAVIRDVVGLSAITAIGWLVWSWHEFQPALYRGGFTLVALLAAVAVAVCSDPGPTLKSLIGNGLMRWIGRRSYSIYLWHWPVFMVTRPQLDTTLTGLPLFILRMALTLSLAAASYSLVEKPVRDGALGRSWNRLRRGVSHRALGPVAAGFAALLIPVLIGGAVAFGAMVSREAPVPAAQAVIETAQNTVQASAEGAAAHAIDEIALSQAAHPEVDSDLEHAAEDPAADPDTGPHQITAIGDSVMLIAKDALSARFEGSVVDVGIGRQARSVIAATQALHDAGELGDTVIVHTGTNGLVTVAQLDQLMEILQDVPRVFVVNVKVARPWEEINNRMLAENIDRFPNARLVDWKSTATAHPQVFYSDGVHLRPSGIAIYVDLLSASVED